MTKITDVDKMKAKRDVKGLFKVMITEERELGNQAGKALVEIGPSVVKPLLDVVRRKIGPFECAAFYSIMKTIGSPAVEPLLAALKGKDDEKCALAVGALGQIGDPRAGEAMLKVLKNRSDRYIVTRSTAAGFLGEILGARAQEPLLEYLNDDQAHLLGLGLHQAAQSLGEIGDEKAIDALVLLLTEGRPWIPSVQVPKIRACAAEALGKVYSRLADKHGQGAIKAENALKAARTSYSELVRMAVAEALKNFEL